MISMENPENPKCNMCKKKWKPDDTDIKKNGDVNKCCKNCREQAKENRNNNKEKLAEKAKERYENNKEKILAKKKEYNKNNKEKQAEYMKEYYENNKEKIIENKKEYYENNKEKRKEYMKEYSNNNKEKLAVCNKEYYENNKDKILENYKNNKDKITEYNKEYRKNNKDKITEYNKEYRKNNKEKRAEYYKNNKEKLAENMKEYTKKSKCEHNKNRGFCKICNLSLFLVNKNRANVNRCLKSSSLNKTKSSIKYLGCSNNYFKDYFKKKMDLWNENNEIKMKWDNIHIDHIKPVSVFNLGDEDELNKCCNYTNFQPLLIEDNLRKNNKWTDEDEVYWNENIINKEHFGIYIPV